MFGTTKNTNNVLSQELTNGDRDQAQFYLESSGWDLEAAVETFYENNVPGKGVLLKVFV